jgi:hypothetical protein
MDESHLEWKVTCEYQKADHWYLLRVWERINDEHGAGQWVCIATAGASADNPLGHSRGILKRVIRQIFH